MIYELDKTTIQDMEDVKNVLYAIIGQVDDTTMALIIAANPDVGQYFKVKNGE